MEKELMRELNRFVLNFEKDCEKFKIGDSNDNIFNILKVEKAEIRHSNFLAWLLDCNAGHKLGNKVLNAFLDKLSNLDENLQKIGDFPFNTGGLEEYNIKREEEYTDILIISEERKFVICIENKTESVEHNTGKSNKKQTCDYRERILKKYDGYHHLFIYLAAKGDKPVDIDNWISTDYKVLSEVLEEILKENKVNDSIYYLIKWYIDILKIDGYAEDKDFADKCQELYEKYKNSWKFIENNQSQNKKLYEKYKDAWEIINKNSRTYIEELKEEVNTKLRNYENEGKITITTGGKEKDYAEICFYTSNMKENFNTEKIYWDLYINNKYIRMSLWTEKYSEMKENEIKKVQEIWKNKVKNSLTSNTRSNANLPDIYNSDKAKIIKIIEEIVEYDWENEKNNFSNLKNIIKKSIVEE